MGTGAQPKILLKNIKSSFCLKIIFSFLDEEKKLKLVKYNKAIQDDIDINLNNYKFFSERYIIYDSNRKGKRKRKGREYCGSNDLLVFEGEYLNGERNGKGKYYWNNKILFEGEFLNGERNGKGKEYEQSDNLIFEGEYSKGKKNGKGKDYFFNNGQLLFEGKYLNDKKWNGIGYNSKGKIIYEIKNGNGSRTDYDERDNLLFQGEYLNGERNGKGKEYKGSIMLLKYNGEYLNGKRNGKGKEYFINNNLEFEGLYLNDKKWEGKGYDPSGNLIYELKKGKGLIKEYDEDILIYEGEYINGLRNGKGKEYDEDGNVIFEGEYINGLICGKGKEYIGDGNVIFEGEYINGLRHGKGKEYALNNYKLRFEGEYLYNNKLKGKEYVNEKLEYEGEYLFGKKYNGKGYDENGNLIYELKNGNGKVKEYDEFGKLKFEGEYKNGKRNGKGKEYDLNYIKFEGEYLNGLRNGKGKEYNGSIEMLLFEGEYLNGKKNGKGKEYNLNGNLLYEGEYLNGKRKY